MPPKDKNQTSKPPSKEAEAAARADREKQFKADSESFFKEADLAAQAAMPLASAFDLKQNFPKEVVDKLNALRDQLLKATPPPIDVPE